MKLCKKCQLIKDISSFSKNNHLKDGLSNVCKECHNKKVRDHVFNRRNDKISKGEIVTKICCLCKTNKRMSKFNRSKISSDGYLDECISCKREFKIKNTIHLDLYKLCSYCKINKKVDMFYKCSKIKDGYFNHCIECERIRSNEYHNLFKKFNKTKKRTWDNIESRILIKLKRRIRSSISNILKERKYRKKCKTIEIIGCSFVELKSHLESQFEPWMNWENHGKYNGSLNYGWDIDHIIPSSIATDEEHLIKLSHYSNLQPLCSKINRDIKKDKV